MTVNLAPGRARRRTNPERSADTRQHVMDAVIKILNEKGFSALTNALIISDTGISSGALMYHFPTRQKLLIATVEHIYGKMVEYRRVQLEQLKPGLPRFRALIDLSWETARMPIGFAVNEIRIGARSDAKTAATFRPVFSQVANDYGRFVTRTVREAGLAPDLEVQGLWIATSMAMRSLAIDSKTYVGADVAASTLLALRTLREYIVGKQLGKAAMQDPAIVWRPMSAGIRSAAKRTKRVVNA